MEPVPPEIIDEINDEIDNIIDGKPIDPEFGQDPVLAPEQIEIIKDKINDLLNQIPVDPEFGVEPDNDGFPGDSDKDTDDGTIDEKPINPGPDDDGGSDNEANRLRSITVEIRPEDGRFENVEVGFRTDDIIRGVDENTNKLRGRGGDDLITGADRFDYLFGNRGSDTLNGGKGNDVLEGKQGPDELNGGSGNDVLYGGRASDTLTGGTGEDIFVLSKKEDLITDFDVTQDAIGIVYALDLTFHQEGDNLRIKGNKNVNTLLLNVQKDKFLQNYPDNLQIIPVVEVDAF